MKEQFSVTSDHPMLRDHVVHGRHLLPGLAYVDLVYQFLRGSGHSFDEWELRELSIYEPLAVSAGKPVLLTVEASRNPDDSLKILIQSQPQGEADDGGTGAPRRHVIVQAHRVPRAAFTETIDLPAIQKTAFAIDVDQIYGHYADLGLKHGDFMKVHGSVYVADGAVYADVTLSNSALSAADAMLFNPALLDGSAVCGSVGLAHAKALASRRLSLPLFFRSFRASAPLQTGCIARLRTDQVRRRNEVSYVSVEFFDRKGRKIAELNDLGGTAGVETERTAPAAPAVEAAAASTGAEQEHATRVRAVVQLLRDWFAAQGTQLPASVDQGVTFAELGVDSAGLLQLLRELEIKLNTPLSPTLLFEYGNLNELATHLADTYGDLLVADVPASAAASPSPAEPPAEQAGSVIESFLRGQIAESLGIAPEALDRNANFSELGVDSAGLLSLLADIEKQAGVGLSPTLLFEYHNLAELTTYLTDHHGPALQASLAGRVAAVVGTPPSVETPAAPVAAEANTPASSPAEQIHTITPTVGGRDIAIIGISGRFPGAGSVDELWDTLKSGRDCIQEIPLERWDYRKYRYYEDYARWGNVEFCHWGGFIDDVDKFDAGFFNIQPIHAECMDPQERLFLQTTWQLLENAGYTRARLREEHRSRVGVYVGSMYHDYSHIEADIGQELGSFLGFHSSLANRVSHFFDLQGPSLALDTMCSSTAVAIHTACRDMLFGDCELAVVGGVNLSLHHKKFIGLSHEKQIGTHIDSRSFSNSDGYLPAEAVGAVLLKPLERAIARGDRIVGVIKATAVNHSGRSNGYTVPNPTAQAQLIEECLARAGVEPATVSYVEATSNGAMFGDPMELVALNKVFSKRTSERAFCAMGTVKSNIGHAEAASALTQLAKVVLQFEHRQLPPSIKTEPLHPLAAWKDSAFHLVHELQEWKQPTVTVDGRQRTLPRRAILNSFGAGGTNATLVLEEFIAPTREAGTPGRRAEIIALSARTPDRVPLQLRQLHEHVRRNPQLTVADIAYTLQLGREAMAARVAFVASTRDELLAVLEQALKFDPSVDRAVPANLPLFFGDGKENSAVKGLIDSHGGKAMIEVLVRDHDASRLAMLWTQGAAIPWERLHKSGSARIVPLPTYPFKKDRYWLQLREPSAVQTASGAPDQSRVAQAFFSGVHKSSTHVEPRNDIERTIAGIWEEALGVEGIGVKDSFFELGGNSLLAGVVIARLSEAFNMEIDWGLLLGADPTIEGFSTSIVSKLADGLNERELEAVLANS